MCTHLTTMLQNEAKTGRTEKGKRQIDNYWRLQHFLSNNRASQMKNQQGIKDLRNTVNQPNLIDGYRILTQ